MGLSWATLKARKSEKHLQTHKTLQPEAPMPSQDSTHVSEKENTLRPHRKSLEHIIHVPHMKKVLEKRLLTQ